MLEGPARRRVQGRHAASGTAPLLKLLNSSCSRCSRNRAHADHFLVNINSKSGRAAAGMPARSSRGRRNTPRRCTARQGLRSIVASTATPPRRGALRRPARKNRPRFVSNSHDEPLCVTLQLVRMSGRRAPFRRDLTADSGRRADPNSTQPLSAPRRRSHFVAAPIAPRERRPVTATRPKCPDCWMRSPFCTQLSRLEFHPFAKSLVDSLSQNTVEAWP